MEKMDRYESQAGAILSFRNVSKTFTSRGSVRSVEALRGVELSIEPGEFVSVVGPSGCGKSTLLNLAVGLEFPTQGTIHYRGEPVKHEVNTHIGYITQEDNLFPWRTLQRNVEFAMEVRGFAKRERRQIATDLLAQVGLSGFGDRYRHELSGGMRQRGHIARTLAYEPDVILMDEPFGPLDVQTRLLSQQLLLQLWRDRKLTIIFITHDLQEAIALADRVVVLTHRPGQVKDVIDVPLDRPRDVFSVHTSEAFRELYDPLWFSLQEEMQSSEGALYVK